MISFTAGKVTQNLIYMCFLSPSRFKLLSELKPCLSEEHLSLPLSSNSGLPGILVLVPFSFLALDTPAVVLTVPSAWKTQLQGSPAQLIPSETDHLPHPPCSALWGFHSLSSVVIC